jgi:hypothetical protein
VGKSRGRVRNERGLVDKTVHPEPEPTVWPPDLEAADRDPVPPIVVPVSENDRIIQRMTFLRGRVIEFPLMQEHRQGNSWWRVVRVDTCHDEVHVHRYAGGGNEFRRDLIKPITCQADVEAGLDEAEALIFDQWEENLRRWHLGR